MAFYRRKDDPSFTFYARFIGRGFSCTREELPREIATHCRAIPSTLEYTYAEASAKNVLLADAVSRGFKVESRDT